MREQIAQARRSADQLADQAEQTAIRIVDRVIYAMIGLSIAMLCIGIAVGRLL